MLTLLYMMYLTMALLLIGMVNELVVKIMADWKPTKDELVDAISHTDIPFGFQTDYDDEE